MDNKNFFFKYSRRLPLKLKQVCKDIEFYCENVNEIVLTDYS